MNINKKKSVFSMRSTAAYSLYVICYQRERFFEEFKIIRFLNIEVKIWKDVIQHYGTLLRDLISNLPTSHLLVTIVKMCRSRYICRDEEEAMIEMSQRVQRYANIDVKFSTVAALVFWIVCRFSKRYRERIVLSKLCKNHERLILNKREEVTFKMFDVTPENVRRVYREHIKDQVFEVYLPVWRNRVSIFDQNNNFIERE